MLVLTLTTKHMPEQTTCPHFTENPIVDDCAPLKKTYSILPPKGECPALVTIEIKGTPTEEDEEETSDAEFRVYDGDLNGKEMTLDMAGLCQNDPVNLLAVTKTCHEKLCSSANFADCPKLKDRPDHDKILK